MEEHQNIVLRLKEFKHTIKLETEIWDFVDCLMDDLKIYKNHNENLEKQLENVIILNEQSIPAVYVKIREQNCSLNERNSKLEDKIKDLETNLKEMKQHYDQREKEFFEELQMVQVTSAMDFDKIEQKLKWQLSEANKKVQEKNIIITKLQMQIRNLEEQKNCSANTIFFPPMNDALFNENQTAYSLSKENPINEDELLQIPEKIIDSSVSQSDLVPTTNSILRTYQPLQVKCSVASEDKTGRSENPRKHITPLFKGKNYVPKRYSDNKPRNPTTIPPLMPCSSSKYAANKKRKLHDPDDLSYLVQLMGDGENDE